MQHLLRIGLACLCLGLSTHAQGAGAVGQDSVLAQREVRVLDVRGTPHERGLAHGRALKAEIHELLGDFKADLEATYQVEAGVFIQRFLAETNFEPAIEAWVPGLLDEVRGIAEGSELPYEEIYAFQLADEIWSMGGWAMREKCTAIAVNRRGEQPTIVAQNMDIPGFYQKYPTLLRVHHGPDEPVSMVFTCPGLIGVNGLNSNSIAVACNTLLQLKPSREGVPCLFIVRGVLEQATFAAAEDWLLRVPHAVGQNYTIGGLEEAKAFECSAESKQRFSPVPDGDFTYHTNHPLVNQDWHPDYLARCFKYNRLPAQGLYVCHRFGALERRVQAAEPITLEVIKAALASQDDRRGPIAGDHVYGCTLFILGEEPYLLLAPGRADRTEFQRFGF